jgi:S-adenosylmethionine-dependent methyltransferase
MTSIAPERFDADPSAYEEYLRTPLGRLRSELSWQNLEPHLPRPATTPPRALDLGAGTAELAFRLAAAGWSVTLVDGSRRMLARAAELAEARGLGTRIECRALDLDTGGVANALGGNTYDLVVCHHVLEYVASPEALLGEARAALAAEGRMSLVVRNLAGEVMKHPGAALEIHAARRVREDLYGLDVRLFAPDELRRLLVAAGLEVVVERGVRVAADHLGDWAGGGDDAFGRMLELERRLGESPELLPLARYVQVIAAHGQASVWRDRARPAP